ncbi:lipoyl domain-containing protein [Nocardioides sp. WL0053]|jgi:pyruvate/2-oxoglutarate dehydrogenase complex dihydrolipoamide acyltransferase (E2) component|uniref:Lipoyl domain-containing protein n=1 Tax=Nocardioides jiangsuensis TaxID=2866161 RepID=A0ABS7RLT1_9ACTN|nr:lipoyl domain-containing protein [Nocardioides jiangsuensis]MBY9076019.1 lipoyl domain-containing protein [Nocardioides jiangsuensis]
MTDVLFPALSEENPDAEGVLATWFVTEGSAVTADQLLAEVQVDKVSAEVLAPSAGVVHLLVEEEAAVPQGTPVARIE